MMLILHGEDTYRSREKLRKTIKEYQEKFGADLNMHRIDGEEKDIGGLKELCAGQSLFFGYTLVVAENFLHDCARFESILERLRYISGLSDVTLILWEREIAKDKQKKLASFFNAAKIQEYILLENTAKQKFIDEEAAKRNIRLTSADRARMMQCNDSWGIINQLDMCMLILEEKATTSKAPLSIYALGDIFFSRAPQALDTLLHLIQQGEDEFGMFNYTSSYIRTLFMVKLCAEQRTPLLSSLGIHPFVAKKALFMSRNLSQKTIEETHAKFFEEDVLIKTGVSRPRDSLINMLIHRAV